MLYVETYWHGMTTYYSDILDIQHPRMASYTYGEYGNDYMLALISECHKVGIEVHAWVELLKAGFNEDTNPPYIEPEWLCRDLEGNYEGFVDPSNPEVTEFLKLMIGEMINKYDFDGISYDYIRYSETGDSAGYIDSGFSEYSIKSFSEQYGYNNGNLINDLKTDTALREQWHSFKRNSITALVASMSGHIRSIDPEMIISASPYGYIDDARDIYMQDIDAWLRMGYLDVVLPMLYTENVELLTISAADYEKYSQMVLQYTGIAPLYNGASLSTHQELVSAINDLNISGVSLFASQNYITKNPENNQKILRVLSSTTHRGSAVSPTADANEIFSAWRDQLFDRYQRIYSSRMTENERRIIESFNSDTILHINNPKDLMNILSILETFKEQVSKFGDTAVKDRITEQIDYIYTILDASISRYLIRYGYWDVQASAERPDVYTLNFE